MSIPCLVAQSQRITKKMLPALAYVQIGEVFRVDNVDETKYGIEWTSLERHVLMWSNGCIIVDGSEYKGFDEATCIYTRNNCSLFTNEHCMRVLTWADDGHLLNNTGIHYPPGTRAEHFEKTTMIELLYKALNQHPNSHCNKLYFKNIKKLKKSVGTYSINIHEMQYYIRINEQKLIKMKSELKKN